MLAVSTGARTRQLCLWQRRAAPPSAAPPGLDCGADIAKLRAPLGGPGGPAARPVMDAKTFKETRLGALQAWEVMVKAVKVKKLATDAPDS